MGKILHGTAGRRHPVHHAAGPFNISGQSHQAGNRPQCLNRVDTALQALPGLNTSRGSRGK